MKRPAPGDTQQAGIISYQEPRLDNATTVRGTRGGRVATANPLREAARVSAPSGRPEQPDCSAPGGKDAKQTRERLGKVGVTARASR